MRRYIIVALVLCVLVGVACAWPASMGSWDYRKSVTINNTGANLTNYQLMFTVNRSAGSDSGFTVFLDGKCAEDYDDIRFTTSDEETLCDYWIESSSSTVASIWVEVPSIVNSTAYGSTTLYLYYGNAAASAVSDGDATFPFFDDFPGSSINTSKWDTSGTISVSGSIMSTGVGYVSTKQTFGVDYAARSKAKLGHPSTNYGTFGFYNVGTWTHGAVWTGINGATSFLIINKVVSVSSTSVTLIDDYHIFEIQRTASKNNYYSDGILKKEDSNYVSSNSLNLGLFEDTSGTTQSDWILIRKYTATAPTVSTWGSEETDHFLGIFGVDFSGVPTTGYTPLTVYFTDESIVENATINTWQWSFGDSTPNSTQQNPVHTYTTSGLYNVVLTITNTSLSLTNTTQKNAYINATANLDAPTADFTVTETCGDIGDTFYFIDFSTGGGLYAWNWSFGDGSYSELRNPTHQYASNGTYSVNLSVWGAYGFDSLLRENLITIPCGAATPTPTPTPTPTGTLAGLTADFYAFPTSGQANLTVHFTDDSTGSPSNWNWTFDYGNPAAPTSTDQNPSHIYSVDGWYTVSLTAGDGTNSDTEIKTRYIHVGNVTQGIPERHGETWIRWTWTPNATYPYDIYIDGILSEPANTLGYYYLTGLNPNEKHRIDLYDSGNPIATSTTTTDKESYLAYILVIMGVVFAIITMLVIEPGKVILSGGLTFIISMYLATNTWSQLGPISFIGIGLTIFAGVWIARAVWALCRDRAAWW